MQLKWKGKAVYSYSVKRLVYALCFFLFCIIEQRTKTCSGLDGWSETFRDLTGVGVAVLIMSHYKFEDFKKYKIPYIIWSVISAVGGAIAFLWGRNHRPFMNDWIVVIIDVVLFGYIIIHTLISIILEKRCPKLNKNFAITWLIMMVLMIASRSTYIWPFCYLVMFGCFYLTDYSREELQDLFQGMLDGIIMGFFVFQGLCLVFRPYDSLRYLGLFSNPNWNALFYTEVLAAVLTKIIYVTKIEASKWIRLYYWVGAGAVLSFELLTIGRAGWMTSIILILIFLQFLCKVRANRRWLKNLLVLFLCTVMAFPLCFTAVRYLPPVFHHPVWFWGEWNESKVHSWDAWDSEKYIDFDEYMDASIGRIVDSFTNLLEHSPLAIKADAEEADPRVEAAVLTPAEGSDAFLIRKTIYQYYFHHLNWRGHPYEEQGFQLTPTYWIGHAHNIYLQYGTDFGIPVMILFIVLILWSEIILLRKTNVICPEQNMGYAMFLLIPGIFGLAEYSWGVGSLSILMLFVAWKKAICYDID